MSEELLNTKNQQEILKDILAGRDLSIGDIKQQSIEKQINLLFFSIPDSKKDNSEIINAINKAYLATVPDGWFDWREKGTELNDILKQLLEIPSQNPKDLPFLKFIYLLSKDKNIPQATREKLEQLLTKNSFKGNGESSSTQPLHSYLLIQLRPEGTKELLVKAWFIPDDTIQDPWERFKPLTVDEQQPEIPFVPEKLPLLLSHLLQQCFEEYLQGQSTELTIEIFLPRDRLWDEVEKWSYQDSEGFDITIGAEHRVVVRSYDRLKKLRTQQGSYWRKNWENVQLIWKDIPCIKQVTTVSQAYFDPNNLRKMLVEKIVLKVCCNLSDSDRNGLVSAIHSAGTPIVIWSRCEVQSLSNATEFDSLLEKPLHELSARVREQRLAADSDKHLGHHLVLLWDDPNRIPPKPALEFFAW
jgi:hypothetical protein